MPRSCQRLPSQHRGRTPRLVSVIGNADVRRAAPCQDGHTSPPTLTLKSASTCLARPQRTGPSSPGVAPLGPLRARPFPIPSFDTATSFVMSPEPWPTLPRWATRSTTWFIRWRRRIVSNSRKSTTSTLKALPQANSSTALSPSSMKAGPSLSSCRPRVGPNCTPRASQYSRGPRSRRPHQCRGRRRRYVCRPIRCRSISCANSPTLYAPLLVVVSLQLFAYEFATGKGLNIDQPRNLAKSVTVEQYSYTDHP